MSNDVNSKLIEEAQEYITSGELSSTPIEKMLEEDIKHGDLDALWHHVVEARNFLRDDAQEYPDVY